MRSLMHAEAEPLEVATVDMRLTPAAYCIVPIKRTYMGIRKAAPPSPVRAPIKPAATPDVTKTRDRVNTPSASTSGDGLKI